MNHHINLERSMWPPNQRPIPALDTSAVNNSLTKDKLSAAEALAALRVPSTSTSTSADRKEASAQASSSVAISSPPKKKTKMSSSIQHEVRNQREKERSMHISKQIDELQSLLPSAGIISPKDTKSESAVLGEAASYIRMLQQRQCRLENDFAQLVQQMQTSDQGTGVGKLDTTVPERITEPEAELVGIKFPNQNDVLCDAGPAFDDHAGNQTFYYLFDRAKDSCRSSSFLSKADIETLAQSIVERVCMQTPQGRFLQQMDYCTGLWHCISYKKAADRIVQALYREIDKKRTVPCLGEKSVIGDNETAPTAPTSIPSSILSQKLAQLEEENRLLKHTVESQRKHIEAQADVYAMREQSQFKKIAILERELALATQDARYQRMSFASTSELDGGSGLSEPPAGDQRTCEGVKAEEELSGRLLKRMRTVPNDDSLPTLGHIPFS